MSVHLRIRNITIVALVMAFGGGAACGSSSSTSSTAKACDTTENSLHTCVEVEGASASCRSPGTGVDSCPTADALGTCTTTAGDIHTVVTYYSTDGITAADGQAACEGNSGSWAATK